MSHVRKILVPVDGSPSSIAGLSRAVVWAGDLGASIEVLHVVAPDAFQVGSATQLTDGARAEAERATETGLADAERILEVARDDDVDLIVMGTHGRVGRLHALIGSVAEGVVRNAACPVVTVRAPDGEAEAFAERIHGRQGIATQAGSR
jgi:nucleotide-binding universal stress UspA family protein